MNRKVLFVQVAAIHLLVLGLLFGLMNCCERRKQADYGAPSAPGRPPLVEREEPVLPGRVEEVTGRSEILEREEPLVIEEYGEPGLVRESELDRAGERPQLPLEHEILKGETLSGIAQQYGVSLKKIMEVNAIEDPGKIQAGQMIAIPAGGSGGER